MKHLGRKLLFFIIILIPFWSFLAWFFWPKQPIKTLILDKTVLTNSGDEHRSLNWVMTHERYTKPGGSQISIADDYHGFFPVDRPEYQIKDLSPFSNIGLDSLSGYYDMTYFTDAYGIYQNEWYAGRDINERSKKVYGGLMKQDYLLMRMMYERRKLVLSEFNIIASPTPLSIRDRTSNLLGIDFSGWTGRYYHSLDTLENEDIPRWMRRMHENYYKRKFEYEDIPGIVLINEDGYKIVVLEDQDELTHEVPIIHTDSVYQRKYGVPDYIRYPFWFDITFAKDTNNIYASYTINTTRKGDSSMAFHNLPNIFPAVIGDAEEQLKFYFCGDFSDNPIPFGLSYFKGVEYIRKIFYNNRDNLDRKKFFWEYYRPMITTIIDDYYNGVMKDSSRLTQIRPIPSNRGYIPFYRRHRYRRPDLGMQIDKVYSPSAIYGSEARESLTFSEESEYEDQQEETGGENIFDKFLKNVERVPEEDREEVQREIEEDRPRSTTPESQYAPMRRRDSGDNNAQPSVGETSAKQEEAARKKREVRKDSIADYRAAERKKKEEETKEREATARKRQQEEAEKAPDKVKPKTPANSRINPRYMVGGRQPIRARISAERAEPTKQVMSEPKEQEREAAREKEAAKEEGAKSSYTAVSAGKSWKVIVASAANRADAESFVSRNQLTDVTIEYVAKVNSYRVVYAQRSSLAEAQKPLRTAKQRFPKAWVALF